MGPDSLEKVLERMAIGDDVILTVKRDTEGKMRATARTWPDAKVLGRNEVIEIRNVGGQIRVARKTRNHDDWDPPIEPYDPYGPGEVVSTDTVSTDAGVSTDARQD
jgi:hypothetical protein